MSIVEDRCKACLPRTLPQAWPQGSGAVLGVGGVYEGGGSQQYCGEVGEAALI